MKNKILIFVLSLVFVAVSVCAEATDFQSVYMQDFSSVTDVSKNITPQNGKAFTAQIADEALSMKTDSICYFRATNMFDSLQQANGTSNSKGIEYYTTWFVKGMRLEQSETIAGYTVNYQVTQGGTNALILDEIDGLPAIGTTTFKSSETEVKVNEAKFNVTSGGFTSDYNTVKIRVKAFPNKANAPLNIVYVRADNGEYATVNLFKATEQEAGTWVTKEVILTNIDLTKKIIQDPGRYEQQYNMKFNTNRGYDVFIHSIELFKADGEININAGDNTYVGQISEKPLYGDAQLSFDLDFKSGEVCTSNECLDTCIEEYMYNTGKGSMDVNLLNQSKQIIGKVRFSLDGDNGTVSIGYTDDNGNTAFEDVYSGNIIDKNYTYKLVYDMSNAKNMLAIYEGETLVAQTETPLDMINIDDCIKTFAQYYSISQNKMSDAIYSTIDNIGVGFVENPVYKSMQEDLAAIQLPSNVRGDFEVPVTGSINGNEIYWESSNPQIINVVGGIAKINRGVEQDESVTLVATISDGVYTVTSEYPVSVKALKGEYIENFDIIEIDNGDTITASTSVANAGTNGAQKISFVAVSYIDGEIAAVEICEKDVQSQYQKLDFEVTVNKGDKIEYYLWDENNVPVVNHQPHIYSSAFYDKSKGAVIEWENAYDDFGAIDRYQIIRSDGAVFETDGEIYGDNLLRFYDADTIEGVKYEYELIAVDSNQNFGNSIIGSAKRLAMPYYMNLDKEFIAEATYEGDSHVSFIYKYDTARAAYTEPKVYLGEKCIFIPNGKYAAFRTDLSNINKNIVVRFTYATPVETKFKFMYNVIQPDGSSAEISETVNTYATTDGWQTVDFKLEKQFGSGNTFSNGLFGLGSASAEGVYIKKIEFMQLSDYE